VRIGDKVNLLKQGNIVLKEKHTGMLITIQTMVCPEFLFDILSMKQLLQKGHTVTLNSDKGFIECKRKGKPGTRQLDSIKGTDGMYYVIGIRVPHSKASKEDLQ
jgi:hypothetical protein